MSGKVVVTGAGVISAIGAGTKNFEQGVFEGADGVQSSTRFPGAATAEVQDFDAYATKYLGKGIRVLDRGARLLCVAAQMALAETGLTAEGPAPEIGMVCGTMFGSAHSIVSFDWCGLTEGPNYVNPMEFPNTVINSANGQVAIRYKLRGMNSTVCAGLASGLYALNYAAECVRLGRAQMLLAGGAEELCEESFLGFRKTGAISPTGKPRPFATERDGVAPGEGAALWVVETEESAAARNATPWFEICGFGVRHSARAILGYSSGSDEASEAIEQALSESGIATNQIACIISSASGSKPGDAMEARALKQVFGANLEKIPVSAPKGALGESLGAAGAFAAMIAGYALQRGSTPPTVGANGSESGIRVSTSPQPIEGEYALVNALSCDGNCAALVIRKWKN